VRSTIAIAQMVYESSRSIAPAEWEFQVAPHSYAAQWSALSRAALLDRESCETIPTFKIGAILLDA